MPATYTKIIELIDKARAADVILDCFPPHCTHKLQPLDVDFMKPLTFTIVFKWKNSWESMPVSTEWISLLGKAYLKAPTMSATINSLKATGIWYLGFK